MHQRLTDGFGNDLSPVHRLAAGIKLSIAIALILLIVILPPSAIALSIFAATLLVIAGLSRVPPVSLLKRLLLLEPFVLGVALLSIFQPGGWRIMLLIVARCTLCLAVTVLLAATTQPSEMIAVLQKIHAPPLLVTTLLLMYRYLFVLADEAQRMRRARASRNFTHGHLPRWRSIGTIIAQLFVRAADRAERVFAAMCARGWQQ